MAGNPPIYVVGQLPTDNNNCQDNLYCRTETLPRSVDVLSLRYGSAMDLSGHVALVTGASRGVGRGIALGLGEAGATVYVVGRTEVEGTAASGLTGTVHGTARDVTAAGGMGIPIAMDVRDDAQVAAAIERIAADHGRLDILVNAAWGGYERFTNGGLVFGPFWEQPLALWDSMNRIGVRGDYVVSSLAVPLMLKSGEGLIVSVSSFAGQVFIPPVACGVAHTAIDRLARDVAEELRPHRVTSVSLYPGLVLTESVQATIEFFENETNRETPLFVGRVVAALAGDPNVFDLTGRWLVAAELGADYGLTDENGVMPASNRERHLPVVELPRP
jgi:NAD(P)-dependent dehydrogenase (short-subunit alcohol dehydrogenase family)